MLKNMYLTESWIVTNINTVSQTRFNSDVNEEIIYSIPIIPN